SLSFIEKMFTMITGLIASIFLTRYLGVVLKGEFTYVTQIVSILTIILGIGLNQSYSFYYRKHKEETYQKYLNIYSFLMMVYIVFALLLIIIFKNDIL